MYQALQRIYGLTGDKRFLVFRREEMERIHRGSLEVLRDVGCRIDHPRMRELLRKAGHAVDEKTGVVRFDPEAVQALIERHRLEEPPREVPTRIPAVVGGLTTRIYDARADRVRPATKRDLEEACIIGEALPEVKEVGPLFIPQDVPADTCDVHAAQALVARTRKAGGFEIFHAEAVRPIREILTVVDGTWEAARKRFAPVYLSFINSPLMFMRAPLEIAFRAIELGFEVRFGAPMTVAGATGPVTLAGTHVVSNAEALVGLACADATGQKWSYAASPVVLDPQTGATAYSGPDRVLLAAATWDFCRFHGVEPGAHVGFTDAVLADFQAGFEIAYALFFQALAGTTPGLCCGLTGPGGTTGSLPQILLDVECLTILERMMQPVEVSEETLCVELIKRVGIGGNYLAEEHTAAHFREALWLGGLMRRVTAEEYNRNHRTALSAACARVEEILREHDTRVLTVEQEKEVARIVGEADARSARGRGFHAKRAKQTVVRKEAKEDAVSRRGRKGRKGQTSKRRNRR
ncbi:MAG: trimethylamine methyltransferase family protein [Planctomycetota bacterium]